MEAMFYTQLVNKEWPLYLAATEKGLCYVGGVEDTLEQLQQFQQKWLPNSQLVEDADKMVTYMNWLTAYFAKKEPSINFSFDLYGTSFQKDVWKALQNVHYGKTATYSDIARYIQHEKAVRAVGRAIGMNPLTIVLPCHRILGKNGALTGFRGGIPMKIRLLQHENAMFTE
jgi:methylated-DNA-[protein]-cysteine S-methyltransferase